MHAKMYLLSQILLNLLIVLIAQVGPTARPCMRCTPCSSIVQKFDVNPPNNPAFGVAQPLRYASHEGLGEARCQSAPTQSLSTT